MSIQSADLEPCTGCGGLFLHLDGPTHRYMESSASCWATFGAMNDPSRSIEYVPFSALTVDAYAAQHPGQPSHQTVNSVAIHLMVLFGVLERGYEPEQALWLRTRPGRLGKTLKHDRFHWLTPPSFTSRLTLADVVAGRTPRERSPMIQAWTEDVWAAWAAPHSVQVEAWFERYILSERL
ncbi:hypothetical protein FNU79_18545 [Deinococcus detaillensis]|uniref:Uncharacterized protein n=1 Tax=Deinococcus detaillensis TaxID=2592048 RepID=A0A553UFF9_9DEIO|nr:hypothetical protein FNU79_18545 [Deinococcus detaillensis]